MTDVDIPVVPLADAPLSKEIRSYLDGIARDTGRYIGFWDARDIRKADPTFSIHVKARAHAEPDKPYLCIIIDMAEISRRKYSPKTHDPLIAHEAGHLVLWTEGYRPIEFAGQLTSAHWALNAVSNWLADPIINSRIYQLGFDISRDRTREIIDSTNALRRGIWRSKPPEPSIRFAVSFMLEPNIPEPVREDFRQAITLGLDPTYSELIFAIFETISEKAVTSPKLHDDTVKRCFQVLNDHLNLRLSKPRFASKYRRFNTKSRDKWVANEFKSTKTWP